MPTVTYKNVKYEIFPDETVLAALRRQGCEITFSCGKGSCTVCMHRCESGAVPPDSQRDLKPSLIEKGYFLPCICFPTAAMSIEPPRAQDLSFAAEVVAKVELSPDILGLFLEPAIDLSYRSGQFINVIRDDGLSRSYSLASVFGEEPYLELHVRVVPNGSMSQWLRDETQIGDEITLSGPFGENFYRSAEPTRNIVLIGSGTGLAPLYGIAKSAVYSGHKGVVHLFHAGAAVPDLYMHQKLLRLSAESGRLHYHPYSVEECEGVGTIAREEDVAEAAFRQLHNIDDPRIHVAGRPEIVSRCLDLAADRSLSREAILIDAFESGDSIGNSTSRSEGESNNAHADIEIGPRRFQPDHEMWKALGKGQLLRKILDEFYSLAFDDQLLSPYFHGVSRQRVAEKVYSYLRQAFTGDRRYFGNHPRNAHHWMVIDNDIFDYRERMLVDCMRRHGLPEHLVERWRALEEQFRGDIVKSRPKGRIIDGKELPVSGFGSDKLEFATLCDGCSGELAAGEDVRYHLRLGTVYGKCCNDDAILAEAN